MATVRILVDNRERPSQVPSLLERLGVKVSFQDLSVGDYVVSRECAFERKGVGDFISSLMSGRLFDQASRLSRAYKRPALVVEGDLGSAAGGLENPRSVWGAMVFLSFGYGVSVFQTQNKPQTAELLYTVAKHGPYHPPSEPVVRERKRVRTLTQRQLLVAMALPGVGEKLAVRLLAKFGSLRGILSAPTRDLASVKGVGWVRARRIGEVLDARYRVGSEGEISQALLDEEEEPS